MMEIAWDCASVTLVRWMRCTKQIAPSMFEMTIIAYTPSLLTAGRIVITGLMRAKAIVASTVAAVSKVMTTSVAPTQAETVTIHVP